MCILTVCMYSLCGMCCIFVTVNCAICIYVHEPTTVVPQYVCILAITVYYSNYVHNTATQLHMCCLHYISNILYI